MGTLTIVMLMVVVFDFIMETRNTYYRYKADAKYKNYTDNAIMTEAVKNTANEVFPFAAFLLIMCVAIDIIMKRP